MGMGTTIEYEIVALVLSLLALLLSAVHGWRAVHSYRVFHDERAAVSLVTAIALIVISIGLFISASGLIFDAAILSIAGMSVARGALLVLVGVLVLADVRPHMKD
jgi:hypothetical protein